MASSSPLSIQTPAVCLNPTLLDRNIDAILEIAGNPERLWPHIKTYKSSSLVMRLQARGIRSFKCATISEARLLGRSGVSNALLAYPVTGSAIEAFAAEAVRFRSTRFSCLIEDIERLEMIEESCRKHRVRVGVCIDVDTGQGRTGISSPAEIQALAVRARTSSDVRFLGLHVYDGQNHQMDLDERTDAAAECADAAFALGDLIPLETTEIIIAGGTPTFPIFAQYDRLALSPGTALLFDAGYAAAFPDLLFTPAAWVLARVISVHDNDTMTIDVGTKAIATDPSGSLGDILEIDVVESLIHNEEHWVLRYNPGHSRRKPGDFVRIVPTHICPTVNLYNELYLVDDDMNPVGRWRIDGRDRVVD
jgi:D-threonine aldolase